MFLSSSSLILVCLELSSQTVKPTEIAQQVNYVATLGWVYSHLISLTPLIFIYSLKNWESQNLVAFLLRIALMSVLIRRLLWSVLYTHVVGGTGAMPRHRNLLDWWLVISHMSSDNMFFNEKFVSWYMFLESPWTTIGFASRSPTSHFYYSTAPWFRYQCVFVSV